MSAVLTWLAFQPFDLAQDDSSTEPETEPEGLTEEPETEPEEPDEELELEEPTWEPQRVHVPRTLVWAILICFVLLIVIISIWGFARGSWCIECLGAKRW